MPLSEDTKNMVGKIFKGMETCLVNLWCRWQDEKEYEDWADYEKVIKQTFEDIAQKVGVTGATFIKAVKRPMGAIFEYEGWSFQLKMSSRDYDCSARKLPEVVAKT